MSYIFVSGSTIALDVDDKNRRFFVRKEARMPWKFKQIKPQKARGKLLDSMWTDPNWIAEEKYDGDRRIAQFCRSVVRFTGCRESVDGSGFVEKTKNVPHLSGWHRSLPGVARMAPASLDGTVLDGEMIAHTDVGHTTQGMSKFVTSIMGSAPEVAVQKQLERGWLHYVVFDCLWYKGKDVREQKLIERQQLALNAIEDWKNPYVSMAESSGYGQASGALNKRSMLNQIIKHGGEGVVLKRIDHKYGNEKLWVKVKYEATADVVIVGFKSAKEMSTKKGEDAPTMTKYAKAGLIGAVLCGQYRSGKLVEVAAVSGMTDELRKDFSAAPGGYLGEVIEIAHNGREPTGRFRHPRFKRFRMDKKAKACILDLNES